jgi:hypothetical protein
MTSYLGLATTMSPQRSSKDGGRSEALLLFHLLRVVLVDMVVVVPNKAAI